MGNSYLLYQVCERLFGGEKAVDVSDRRKISLVERIRAWKHFCDGGLEQLNQGCDSALAVMTSLEKFSVLSIALRI